MGPTYPYLSLWYYHLPNFVLAALMYTLLGRVLLGLIVRPESSNYIWRFFCRITDPVVASSALVTPKAAIPVVVWLFGVVWLFWLRVVLLNLFLILRGDPAHRLSTPWTEPLLRRYRLLRNDQGYLQSALFAVCLIHLQILAPALLFGSVPLTLMFASLMVSTATIILGGIPAAIYERYWRQGRLRPSFRYGSGFQGWAF